MRATMHEDEPQEYRRKTFNVRARQVTDLNMADVAVWCRGEIRQLSSNGPSYIKVRVARAQDERQTQAFVGDWVLFGRGGFKVYTERAFQNAFEPVTLIVPIQPTAPEIHEDHNYGLVLDEEDNDHLVSPNCD